MTLDRDVRVDVQEKPAVPIAQPPEVPDMEGPALAVELHARYPGRRLSKQFGRQIGLSMRVGPADQALVAHRPAMGETENRLEMAGQAEFAGWAALRLDSERIGGRPRQIRRIRSVSRQTHGVP